MADSDRAQRIVDREATRHIYRHIEILVSGNLVVHTEIARLVNELDVVSFEVSLLLYAVSIHSTGMTLQYALEVLVIRVKNAVSALLEQKALAVQILSEILVLIRTDMVRRYICKNADFKSHAAHTVKLQCLRTHFHDSSIASCFNHLRQIVLHDVTLGSRVQSRDVPVTDDGFDSSDKAYLFTSILKYRLNHVSRRGLALGSGDPDDLQLVSWMIEPGSREKRQGFPCVV